MVAVLPAKEIEDQMRSDTEIERVGMGIVMNYERSQGRIPEDVSTQNLGFDIRSKSIDGEIRYIEVKSRADEGKIALTPNEWITAQRFGDSYWLYIVTNATKNPKLFIVRNPFKNLTAQEVIEVVRYIVEKEDWKKVALEVI